MHGRRTRNGRRARRGRGPRRHVAAQRHVLQPGVAREAARVGTRGVVLRQARRVPRQAPDDEPRRRRGRPRRRRRRQDRRDRARLPAVGEGRGVHLAAPRARRRRARRSAGRVGFADPLDESVLDAYDLVDRTPRSRAIHRPDSMAEQGGGRAAPEVRRVPAHAGRPRRAQARARGRGVGDPPRRRRPARRRVPRAAAVRAHRRPASGDRRDHRADIAGAAPMHRLLQGDVGSGKTVVALAALLVAVQGGYQGAFMAPTEVLAEQHYLGSVRMLEGLDGPRRGLAARRPARSASRCSPTARPRPSGAASRRASRAARSTSSSARTRCSTATPSSRSSGSR